MKTPNRLMINLILCVITACSIPNIWANTNPEVSPSDTNTSSVTIQSPTESKKPSALDHISLLGDVIEEILAKIESGALTIPQQNGLKQELKAIQGFTQNLLKEAEELTDHIDAQVICEILICTHIDSLIDRINGKKPSESDTDALEAVGDRKQTLSDLQHAMAVTDQKFQKLNDAVTGKTKSKLDRTNDLAVNQLCKVDMILEGLAQYIDNQSIKVPNKLQAIEAITGIRAIIETCKYDRTRVTENRIHTLLHLNKKLMEHIKTLIKNNFTNIPTLDPDTLFTRDVREIAPEELTQKYEENEQFFKTLETDSKDAGLTWYNHVFRKANSLCDYSKLRDRIIGTTAALFVASVIAHQFNVMPQVMKDWKIPYTVKKLFGELSNTDSYSGITTLPRPEDRGLVGDISRATPQLMQNATLLVPASYATTYLLPDYLGLKGWYNDKTTKLSNFLLGKKAVKNSNHYSHVTPKFTFKDVIGQEAIKEEFSKIVRYFEDPKSIDNRGLSLEKGYLFTGKTRAGKSFFAEALAGEITNVLAAKGEKLNFLVVPGAITGKQGGIAEVMEVARYLSPCIVFIDEIHLLDLQAGKNNARLNEFLVELSGCMSNDPNAKVFFIAATNKENFLDSALRESGRLGKEIRFYYPTYADRKEFLIDSLERRTVNVNSLDINRFARESEECTFEDLKKTTEDAFLTAKFANETLSQAHLDASFDRNIRGICPNHPHKPSEKEREIIAIHQAGYVLATKLFAPKGKCIAKVTTLPVQEKIKEVPVMDQYTQDATKVERIVHGKMFTYTLNNNESLKTAQEQVGSCCIGLSGYAAGNVLLGKAHNSPSYLAEKRQDAFDIAKKAVSNGININDLDESLKKEYYARAMAFRNACEKKVTALLEKNKEALDALAGTLLKHETLTGRDIDLILSHCTITLPEQDDALFNMMNE